MIRKTACLLIVLILFSTVGACSKEEPVKGDSREAVSEQPGPADTAGGAASDGAEIFAQNCRVCHGEGGKGDICPDLTDAEWKYGNSDEQIFRSISDGRPGGMPGWGNSLSEKEIRDLIKYIRRIGER